MNKLLGVLGALSTGYLFLTHITFDDMNWYMVVATYILIFLSGGSFGLLFDYLFPKKRIIT